MARKLKKRKRKRKQTSLVGAVLMETIAVVVMIGLFIAVQGERSNGPTADEFIRPTVIDDVNPVQCPHCVTVEKPAYSVLELITKPVSNEQSRIVSSNVQKFPWNDLFGRR